jgi:TRAP-type C4-dicarboxylate transport system permease small subunit
MFARRFLKALLRIESAMAAIAYGAVAVLLSSDIVAREVFNFSIMGAQKWAVFATALAGFLGLVMATADNAHLRPQVFDSWLPTSMHRAAIRFGDVLSALIFGVMGWFAVVYVSGTFVNNDQAAVLYIPLWPIQMVMPYAFFSCALRHVAFALWPDMKPAETADVAAD